MSYSAGISFDADVAEPFKIVRFSVQPQLLRSGLNPNLLEAKSAINITPDTYSGVAVVVIVAVDSVRSNLEPSRIPAKTPRINAPGIIKRKTQNISAPVRDRRLSITLATGSLKTQLWPQ